MKFIVSTLIVAGKVVVMKTAIVYSGQLNLQFITGNPDIIIILT